MSDDKTSVPISTLPPMRIFLVKRVTVVTDQLEEVIVHGHSMRDTESGGLAIMTLGVMFGGQVTGTITRLFSAYEDAEEVFEVDPSEMTAN